MKKILSLILAFTVTFSLTACAAAGTGETTASENTTAAVAAAEDTSVPAEATETVTEDSSVLAEAAEDAAEDSSAPVAAAETVTDESTDSSPIRFYVLSGPTGIGALNLWADAEEGKTGNSYEVTLTAANDEIVAAVSNGDADIAAVATNLAATLYNKTEGKISVLAVNTLGVLSLLSSGEPADSIQDLKGKTIYSPGQGANPEYILRYILKENNLDPDKDVTIQFVSEGSELLNVWAEDPDAIIAAPQPVATSLLMQNEGSVKLFDMTDEWNKVSGGSSTLMMGCVIARKDFIEAHPDEIAAFLTEYSDSIKKATSDVEGTAALAESYGIIPKAALAAKAIPQCGLTFVTGDEMKKQLSGYLQVMYDANPKSVGGAMPGDDFYYSN